MSKFSIFIEQLYFLQYCDIFLKILSSATFQKLAAFHTSNIFDFSPR